MVVDDIVRVVEGALGEGMFLVEVVVMPGSVVEVVVDGDDSVTIEQCVALSRVINDSFDREVEDYELTVGSAGVGQPLKVFRQYQKLVGRPVEVMLNSGTRVVAVLRGTEADSITLAWEERVAVEGKKRKEVVERVETYPLAEVRWTKEWLDFK